VNPLVPLALAAIGAVVLLAGASSVARRRRDRRVGELEAIDAGRPRTFRSERYRLVGRPDAVRRQRDGTLVPVELKRRAAPAGGPYPSHVVQLTAYCLLVEEETGRAPRFGLLRYDDAEVRVPWGERERAHLTMLLAAVRSPYDGRADPSPRKCAGCRWSPICDASLAGAPRSSDRRRAT